VAVSQNKKDIKNAFETSHVTQDFAVVARYPIKMTRKKILNEEGKYESILRAMFLLSSFLDHLSCTSLKVTGRNATSVATFLSTMSKKKNNEEDIPYNAPFLATTLQRKLYGAR